MRNVQISRIFIVLLMSVLMSVFTLFYFKFSDVIIVHWNVNDTANFSLPAGVVALIYPLVIAGALYGIGIYASSKKNIRLIAGRIDFTAALMAYIFLTVQLVIIMGNIGQLNSPFNAGLALAGLALIVAGNYLPKVSKEYTNNFYRVEVLSKHKIRLHFGVAMMVLGFTFLSIGVARGNFVLLLFIILTGLISVLIIQRRTQ